MAVQFYVRERILKSIFLFFTSQHITFIISETNPISLTTTTPFIDRYNKL